MLVPQITALLELYGIHLDNESHENLIRHLRVHKLSFMLRTVLGTALMIAIKQIQTKLQKIEPVA